METASNKEEVAAYEKKKKELEEQKKMVDPKEIVRPKISLSSCLEAFAAQELIDGFYSTATKQNGIAQKTTQLATFPNYLVVQLKKFTIGDDWVPKKLDVSVDVPDQLDLDFLRGRGLEPGEEELPEEGPQGAQEEAFQIDETLVAQVAEMGFAMEGCRKAVYHTKNTGLEAAMNWVMEHMEDADFGAPLQLPGTKKSGGKFVADELALATIMSMGFNISQATKALKATDNSAERAVDWIFSHPDELDEPMETEQSGSGDQQAVRQEYKDGNGKYKLVAFISHMGTSTHVGHYVCHILKEGRWVIFNDEKVALSKQPPKDLAYLYLYQRI